MSTAAMLTTVNNAGKRLITKFKTEENCENVEVLIRPIQAEEDNKGIVQIQAEVDES